MTWIVKFLWEIIITKVKVGQKWCAGCNKTLDISVFPNNSAHCADDKRAVDNIYNTAVASNKLKWWMEVKNNPKKLQKVVRQYHVQCPKVEGKRRAAFRVLEYIEWCYQEEQLIRDAVMEMMDEKQFAHFSASRKTEVMTRMPQRQCLQMSVQRRKLF